jgi:hypothetical protein
MPRPKTVRTAVSRLLCAFDRLLEAAHEAAEARRDLERVSTLELHVIYDDEDADAREDE